MSLYSKNFTLLPRPARTPYSFGSDATRARLPDFDTVDQLKEFTHRLIVFKLDEATPSIYVQIKVGAALICVLLAVVMAVFARRMYDKSFWLVRLVRRPSGIVLVPNSFLAFSLIEGVYGIILIAVLFLYVDWYENESRKPTNYVLWILLPWCPLIWGAIWATWGSLFATPAKRNVAMQQSRSAHFFGRAIVVNGLGFAVPFVIFLSILIPGIFASLRYNRAIMLEETWQEQYGNASAFSEEMLQDTQRIWYAILHAQQMISSIFCLWTAYAVLMFLAYTIVSWRLVNSVRRELAMTRKVIAHNGAMALQDSARRFSGSNSGRRGEFIQDLAFIPSSNSKTQPAHSGGARFSDQSVNYYRPSEHFQTTDTPVGTRDQEELHVMAASTPNVANGWRSTLRLPNLVHDPDRPFIALRNNDLAQHRQQTAVRDERLKALRKAYTHIVIHFVAISPACLLFGIIAALQIFSYGAWEQPRGLTGNGYEKWITIILSFVIWVTCLFGSITLLAIAQRAYEPIFSGGSTGSSGKPVQRQLNDYKIDDAKEMTDLPAHHHSKNLGRLGSLIRLAGDGDGRGLTKSTFFESRTMDCGRLEEASDELTSAKADKSADSSHSKHLGKPMYVSSDSPMLQSSRSSNFVVRETIDKIVSEKVPQPQDCHRTSSLNGTFPENSIVLQSLRAKSKDERLPWAATNENEAAQIAHTHHPESDSEEERLYFSGGHSGRTRRPMAYQDRFERLY